jgi:hypothetical protein
MEAQSNPDFEYYRHMVLRRRYLYATYGRLLAFAGCFSLCGLFLPALCIDPYIFMHTMISLLAAILFGLASLAAVLFGIVLWRKARREPSTDEIDHMRRTQRARLFRQAQGVLPWSHRRLTRALLFLFGVVLLLVGGCFLYLFGLRAWDGWGYVALGVFLFVTAGYILPAESQHLPQESAGQLADHWLQGETTEGNDFSS